jgi:hypothetical protein
MRSKGSYIAACRILLACESGETLDANSYNRSPNEETISKLESVHNQVLRPEAMFSDIAKIINSRSKLIH